MEFRQHTGALGAGDDMGEAEEGHTLQSAMTRCAELGAAGFTYYGGEVTAGTKLSAVWFKTRINTNDDPEWRAFILNTPARDFESLSADYQYVQGAIVRHGDVGHGDLDPLHMTLQQAMRHANANPIIKGFTFNEVQAGGRNADTLMHVWFKNKGHDAAERVSASPSDREWGTYLKKQPEDFESLSAGFQYVQGAIVRHGDVGHGDHDPLWMTLQQAMRHANANPIIKGFTFNEVQAGGRNASTLTAVWFKNKGHDAAERVSASPSDREWGTFLKQSRAAARAAIPEGQPPAPIPRSPMSGRTLANSNFKQAYDKAVAPNTMMKLGVKLGDVIQYFCSKNKLSFDDEEGERFFEELQADMTETDSIEQAVQRMWTSYRVLDGREICFMLNDITRDDDEDAVRPAAALTRAINKSCVTAGASRGAAVHPPGNVCFRGGGFDDRYRDFFAAGREFRQPAFLATSFSKEVAQKFIGMRGGSDCVMWVVRIDPVHKCRHVNLVTRHVPGLADEQEYLFAPYSAFTVLSASWQAGTVDDPHMIELLAAVDNKAASEDLPLAPWS